VLRCTPVGVLEVEQSSKGKRERNDRVFVVPDRSPFEGDLQDIRRLPARAVKELEEFFEATNARYVDWRSLFLRVVPLWNIALLNSRHQFHVEKMQVPSRPAPMI